MSETMSRDHFDRILVVDDTTANLQLLTKLLTEHGYTVYPASDGELALEFVRSNLPDLIVLDIRMPGMDGYEVCRRLKADERTQSIPIIFISILEDEREKVKGFQAGAVDYMTKPFQPEEVLARVRLHLRLRELTDHLERTVAERTTELRAANAQLQIELAERTCAKEALQRERALIANIMETSPIGITTIDGNGQITFANTQAVTILGLTKDEITQRMYNSPAWHITDFAGNPFPAEELPFVRVMTTGHAVEDVRHAIEWPDGRRVLLSINAAPLKNEAGRIEGMVAAISDITERQRAEAALRQRETLLNATQRLAKIGGWDWDVARQTTFWTAETYRIHGFEAQASAPGSSDYIDRSLACYDPADRPILLAAFERCAQQGDPYDLEFPFTSADGDRKWIRTTAAAIREEGRIIKVVGSIMDITERKRAEEALRKSEEKYRALFEHVNEGFALHEIIVDERGVPGDYTFLEINPAFEAMTGLERARVIGKTVKEIFPGIEHDPADWIGRYGRVALTGAGITFENYSEPLDRWYQVNAFSPGTGYFAVTFTDITERKAAEDALHTLNTELDRRVLERTAELEAANKEMHDFTYTVSHDLRAPLRHIDGFMELLQNRAGTALDEQCRHYMDAVSGAAQKMGLLIDELLSFSRMGRHAMRFRQVELSPLARDVIRELEPAAAGRNIAWHISDLPVVTGDRSMLRMVLVNLIANALKFTRPRQQARIEIGSLPGQDAEAVIFVRDNGVGFDMTYADKLFGVFQRLHRAEEFEGIGIGLANVRRIIARHGGRVWAEGQVNQGAAFYVSLPLLIQEAVITQEKSSCQTPTL